MSNDSLSNFNFSCKNLSDLGDLGGPLIRAKIPLFYHMNARRISNRSRFEDFVEHLESFPEKPEVISAVETWFFPFETGENSSAKNPVSMFEIPGYKGVFASRGGDLVGGQARSGGVAVWVRDDVSCRIIEKNSSAVSFIHLEICSKALKSKLFFTSLYMPMISHYRQLFETLERVFVAVGTRKHLITGDMNFDVERDQNIGREYLNLLSSFQYSLTNDVITRPSSSAVIDHVLSNFDGITNLTLINDISDHCGIATFLPRTLCHCTTSDPTDKFYFTRRTDFDAVVHGLNELNLCVFDGKTPHEMVTLFVQQLTNLASQNTIVRRVKKKGSATKPWLRNRGLIALCKTKKRLLARSRHNPENIRIRDRLKDVSRRVSRMKQDLRRSHFVRKFDCSQSCRSKWNEINRLVGRSKSAQAIRRLLNKDRSATLTDPKAIGDEINTYFSEMPASLQAQIPRMSSSSEPLGRSSSTFFAFPPSPFELLKIIRRLEPRKSPGLDGLTNLLLKSCAEPISRILCLILNAIFVTGTYPDCLKLACVVPIFKSGSTEKCENYRPISILTGINRVLETAINDRLISFMDRTGFLARTQYGFRKKSNTSIAAYEALNFVFKSLDQPAVKVVTGLFLDLSKAFDLVDHKILLQKLYNCGFRGRIHEVLESYLTNRAQKVRIGDVLSDSKDVKVGVPQGSVLGPTLFLIYVNDISSLRLNGRIYLYADDATLFYPAASRTITCALVQQDLETLRDFFSRNLLLLNKSKTKIIHFFSRQQTLDAAIPVVLDGEEIETVTEIRHLGLILNSTLDWSSQCKAVAKKVSSGVGALFQCRSFLPQDVLMTMYHSFVHVHLCYIVGLWGDAAATFLDKIQVLQNRALKLVMGLPLRTSTFELYSVHVKTVLPVRALHKLSVLKYLKQCLNREAYNNLEYNFKRRISNLRDNYRLARPTVNNGFGRSQLEFCAPTYFNRLPIEIRQEISTESFVSKVKDYLLSAEELQTYL